MDLQEKAPAVADELRAQLRRHIGEPDRLGRQVVLQALEAPDEVAIDLVLQVRQGRRAHLGVALADLHHQPSDVLRDELELHPDVALRGLVARDVEAALEGLERIGELGRVHRRRASDPDGGDQRGEVFDDLELLRLILGDEEQHRVDLGDARERAECLVLLAKLLEGVRAGERREAGAPGRREDALFPDDGLGAERLEVEQVVVELDVAETPRGHQRQGRRHDQDRLGIGDEALDERHVHALERDGARNHAGRADGVPAVDEDQGGR